MSPAPAITILDGGMGKELRRIGAPFRQPEWSALALMEAPDRVVEAHRNFIDAGAEVIITSNYAVVPYHLGDEMIAARGRELTELAGRLARAAADAAPGRVEVAGSLPPLFGSYLPERFDVGRAAPLYRDMVEALDPFVDRWVGETLSCIGEAVAVLEAIGACGSRHPVWLSFSLPDSWDIDAGIALRTGETMADVADAIAGAIAAPGASGASSGPTIEAVLFNCSLPEQTGPALRALAAELRDRRLDLRTGGYANAFPTTVRDPSYAANSVVLERRDDLTADRYADIVAGWIDDGATIVGGCCDMYPEHIAALATRFGRP